MIIFIYLTEVQEGDGGLGVRMLAASAAQCSPQRHRQTERQRQETAVTVVSHSRLTSLAAAACAAQVLPGSHKAEFMRPPALFGEYGLAARQVLMLTSAARSCS